MCIISVLFVSCHQGSHHTVWAGGDATAIVGRRKKGEEKGGAKNCAQKGGVGERVLADWRA